MLFKYCELCGNPFTCDHDNTKFCATDCREIKKDIRECINRKTGFTYNFVNTLLENEKIDRWTLLNHDTTTTKFVSYGLVIFFQDTLYARLSDKFYKLFGDLL